MLENQTIIMPPNRMRCSFQFHPPESRLYQYLWQDGSPRYNGAHAENVFSSWLTLKYCQVGACKHASLVCGLVDILHCRMCFRPCGSTSLMCCVASRDASVLPSRFRAETLVESLAVSAENRDAQRPVPCSFTVSRPFSHIMVYGTILLRV